MSRIILKMSMSLDGFVAGPNGELDWIFKSSNEISRAWVVDKISKAQAHLMGSKTFASMSAHWPTAAGPFAAPMNDIPKVVFSQKGLDKNQIKDAAGNWSSPEILSGDLKQELTALKSRPGKDFVAHGGAAFAQSLVKTGMIDEYWLVVHPIALGQGLQIFSKLEAPLGLQLVSATSFATGAVAKVYRG